MNIERTLIDLENAKRREMTKAREYAGRAAAVINGRDVEVRFTSKILRYTRGGYVANWYLDGKKTAFKALVSQLEG